MELSFPVGLGSNIPRLGLAVTDQFFTQCNCKAANCRSEDRCASGAQSDDLQWEKDG